MAAAYQRRKYSSSRKRKCSGGKQQWRRRGKSRKSNSSAAAAKWRHRKINMKIEIIEIIESAAPAHRRLSRKRCAHARFARRIWRMHHRAGAHFTRSLQCAHGAASRRICAHNRARFARIKRQWRHHQWRARKNNRKQREDEMVAKISENEKQNSGNNGEK